MANATSSGLDPAELAEWLESLEHVLEAHGPDAAHELLGVLASKASQRGVKPPFQRETPYINTIPKEDEPRYPGSWEIERRIKSINRWNAMAMVVRANRAHDGIGGHISSYASLATIFEVGFNHFFKAKSAEQNGDFIYFQGHASPGVYARAFLEGRLEESHLRLFRQEANQKPGLSSYPHPWLMPEFWEFPTVSMGLAPIQSIYQARFNRYLQDRGIRDTSDTHVWAFVGDGETDEPETLGAISLAAREKLDNLIWVINCNLQRLDGPVRGNGKIIQELETVFRGAGWNVIKVIWGGEWDPIIEADDTGLLVRRMDEAVDGEYQKYSVEDGSYTREKFFGKYPELLPLVEHLTDEQIRRLTRGGHDSRKVYAAYKAAVDNTSGPTVILAKTVKGYGLGEAGEGRNVTHQQKKLNYEELREFRSRFGIPVGDDEIDEAPFYKPDDDSPEMVYLRERREELGGYMPGRTSTAQPLDVPDREFFGEFFGGSGDREVATTMAFVRSLGQLMRQETIGERVVPIIPDEARTFGMDALFRKHGIYSNVGQLYEPVDKQSLLYYREAKDGQLLEEGITESGAMSSFIAAATAYLNHGIHMVPFYIYYSMFGFQRIGDLIWAASDSRAKGFLLGATAGRTTLAGEGLQHQDGHSHILAATVPTVKAYDPAFAYEVAVIVHDGLRRMYENGEVWLYYITLYNETYQQPAMPDGAEEGILAGMYKFAGKDGDAKRGRPQLLGSGPIVREVLRAQEILERYQIGSDVWSVTSYKELRRDALEIERWNWLHPDETPRKSYLDRVLEGVSGPFIAASDYMKLVPEQISRWLPGALVPLGTDGFGRSDTREELRRHFEISAEHIAFATLSQLAREGSIERGALSAAIEELGIDPEAIDPAVA